MLRRLSICQCLGSALVGLGRACLHVVLAAGWLGAGLSAVAAADTHPSRRVFVFVVETSSATSELADKASLALADMIQNGISGRMRAGDVFTLWTYNDKVAFEGFPLTEWVPEQARPISNQAFLFLKRQSWRRKPKPELVMLDIQRVVQHVPDLTVYLVHGGFSAVNGTPFDRDINLVYEANNAAWRRDRLPCFTALAARHGQFYDWAVGVADPPAPVRAVAKHEAPVIPEPPKTNPASAAPPPPVEAKAAVASPAAPPAKTKDNPAAVAKPAETVVVKSGEPKPPPVVVAKPENKTEEKIVKLPQVVKPEVKPGMKPEVKPPPVVMAPPKPVPVIISNPPVRAELKPPTKPLVVVPVEPPVVRTLPASAVVAVPTPVVTPAPVVVSAATNSGVVTSLPPVLAANPSTNQAALVAAAVPQKSSLSAEILAGALALLALGGWLGWLWYRRSWSPAAPSFITMGMSRDDQTKPR